MSARIRRVQIRNYKSIGKAVVELEPFTALVGPNGAGKSNFVDALAFVQECLSQSIELAFRNRGGIGAVRRRSGGHPTNIGLRVELELAADRHADYSFEIAAVPGEGFRIARERCRVDRLLEEPVVFEVLNGQFKREIAGIRPKLSSDRLALFAASAVEEFRPVYEFLTSMRVYSIVPSRLRHLQDADAGDLLKSDGSNTAAVLKRLMDQESKAGYERLCSLLAKIVQGVKSVAPQDVGQMQTLQFRQDIGLKDPWSFEALNMSDGTLRALGLLLAVYQPQRPSLLAIEEPEATIHPAAAELVVQVLLDAASDRQVLFTTHSPDILDSKMLQDQQIRVVSMQRGSTLIAPVSMAGREAIQEHLYTPGELLRNNELQPDIEAARQAAEQLQLFGSSMQPDSNP